MKKQMFALSGFALFGCALFGCSSSPLTIQRVAFGSASEDGSGNTLSLASAKVDPDWFVITGDAKCADFVMLSVGPFLDVDVSEGGVNLAPGPYDFDLAATSSANGVELAYHERIDWDGPFVFVFSHPAGLIEALGEKEFSGVCFRFQCNFYDKGWSYTYFNIFPSNIEVTN